MITTQRVLSVSLDAAYRFALLSHNILLQACHPSCPHVNFTYHQYQWTLMFFKVISGEAVRWHLRLQPLWYHEVVSFEFGSQILPLKSNFKDLKIFPLRNRIIISVLRSLPRGLAMSPSTSWHTTCDLCTMSSSCQKIRSTLCESRDSIGHTQDVP